MSKEPQVEKSSMSKVGKLRNCGRRGVSGTEGQSSTCRIKRWCPAKMVPSVSTTERERTGEAERERAFLWAGRGSLPNRLISIPPPCLCSSRPFFFGPSCLELREGEIEGCIQSSTSNASHAPPSDPAPFVTVLAEAARCIPTLAKRTMGKKRRRKEKEGVRHQSVHQSHWVSLKQLVSVTTWEGSGTYRS